ncbi:MAG TPA: DUF4383 domain-containing protein [Gemmatimonadaceae bacterium]|nr:DUF4383 domain-containing protein [Gemmatimonadaceae bacterium]
MVKRVALIFGVIFLVIGVAGYLTDGGMDMGADPAPALLFGLFPVNFLHNAVHVAFGLWGIVASRSFAGSRNYARIGGMVYLVLTILAFVDPTAFGFVPIGGHDIWLHAVLAAALLFFGFMAKEEGEAAPSRVPDRT